mmetsp:Transcript_23204/g.39280  ORF Transcript_23204/g.39280 Transcript_23204/m.39280 type:complete len:109 (+) Transcript_23204:347-673(+)
MVPVSSLFTKASSCDTTMIAPSNFSRASPSAATDSASKWLVGSSRISTSGRLYMATARATRIRCPPDKYFTGTSAVVPEMPQLAKYPRYAVSSWRDPMFCTPTADPSS